MTTTQPTFALSLFQARIALIGLEFENKTGMKMTAKVNTKKLVAENLGLPVRSKYPVLIEALKKAINDCEAANGEPITDYVARDAAKAGKTVAQA